MKPDITLWTVGHLTVDDVLFWDGSAYFGSAGGDALYAAIGASLLGVSARVATRLGDGFPIAELERIHEFGVDLVPTGAGEPCISQWVLYEDDGSRTYVLHPGSGSLERMSPAPGDYEIPRTSAVHLAPMPVKKQLEWCISERLKHPFLTVDPHSDSCETDRESVLSMAAHVDAFLPSELEAEALSGNDPVKAALQFRSAGAPVAGVKLGGGGSIVATSEGVWHVPAAEVEVVDTTGAGDGYCGAFAAALALGHDGLSAARWATAAASAIVEVHGTAIPSVGQARRQVAERAESIQPALLTHLSHESARTAVQPTNRRV